MQVVSTSSPGRCHQLLAEKFSQQRREEHVIDVVMSYLDK
jgi:hypothetical protein